MKIPKQTIPEDEVVGRGSIFYWLVLLGFFCCFIFGATAFYQLYSLHAQNAFTRTLTSALPLPAGSVDGEVFFYWDVFALERLASAESPEKDSFGEAVNALTRQIIIKHMAEEADVHIEANALDSSMWNQYEWTQKQYERYVLEPLAYAKELEKIVYDQELYQQEVLDEAGVVLDLYTSGSLFSDLAMQYSEAVTGQYGGDIGYHCVDELDQDLQGVWLEEIGMISPLIEREDQYVFLEVYDRIESDDEYICTSVGMAMIVFYKKSFTDIFEQRRDQADVVIFGN